MTMATLFSKCINIMPKLMWKEEDPIEEESKSPFSTGLMGLYCMKNGLIFNVFLFLI